MNTYKIIRGTSQQAWESVPTFSVDNSPWLPQGNIRMNGQMFYDDTAIYVHHVAVEACIRAEHSSPLAQVCEDSCMEFFFSPVDGDTRYFNFEWNQNGCLYLGFRTGREQAVRLQVKDPVEEFEFHSNLTDDGWEIFYKIPLSLIQLFFPNYQFCPGMILRANCYKCGDKTVQPHYLTWNPSTSPVPDYHRPQDFGQMILA